ncbi:MAG: hypothetical protein ACI9SE_004566, partial [Neolewinella sp.]
RSIARIEVGNQFVAKPHAALRSHVDGEEVGGGNDVSVHLEEGALRSSPIRAPCGAVVVPRLTERCKAAALFVS